MNNNNKTNSESNNERVTLNIPVKTTRRKLKLILASLDFDAPLPALEDVSKVNLQVEFDEEAEKNEQY